MVKVLVHWRTDDEEVVRMICPYCGRMILTPNKEHYFPQSIVANQWDFWVCRDCNRLKGQHIVYPTADVFKLQPSEFSLQKFERLWEIAPWDKYLNILPAHVMRTVFDTRKWYYGSYTFTIKERQFYGLDRLKEIYEFAESLMLGHPEIIALVMSATPKRMYLVHTYEFDFPCVYPEVKTINVHVFMDKAIRGWLMLGSAKKGMWKSVSSYKPYFRDLLSAPYSKDLL